MSIAATAKTNKMGVRIGGRFLFDVVYHVVVCKYTGKAGANA